MESNSSAPADSQQLTIRLNLLNEEIKKKADKTELQF